MDNILYPLIGGILIGLSSSLILYTLGKITGISGIFASSFVTLSKSAEAWKYFFVLGLLLGGFVIKFSFPDFFNYSFVGSVPLTIIAGLLVGYGTRLGSGCTSGHGVCGIPRLSLRSISATLTFMIAGIITVYIKGLL